MWPSRRWPWLLPAALLASPLFAGDAPDPAWLASLPRAERVRVLSARAYEAVAAPAEGGVRIDGRVEERDWERAAPVTEFYQREKNEGLPASERTEVRILYDSTHLYFGFRCLDSRPDLVQARAMFRDESQGADDLVSIMIDSYNDQRSSIQFVINANGAAEDLLQLGETTSTRNHDFDTVWQAAGRRTEAGWEAEVAIPFKSLRFKPQPAGRFTFGLGLKRNIPRKNEEAYWPFVDNNSSWYRPAALARLTGLERIRPGRSLEFQPYAAGRGVKDYPGAARRTGDLGMDVKWGITPGLTADFTINTDFAQEEADIQQINFSRFSLFFPEKRQFFLEGQRMFQFGLPGEADLVFTRRIGLSARGEVIPVMGGARLSGREGAYTLGAMSMQTGEAGATPSENFSVLRLRRDVLKRSQVGVLLSSRQSEGAWNRVYAADASFLVRDVWSFEGFLAGVDRRGRDRANLGLYGRAAYDTDRFGWSYRYLDLDAAFDPGVGFVRRADQRDNRFDARWSPRPRFGLVRRFTLEGKFQYLTSQRNVLETRARGAEFSSEFESGDLLSLEFSDQLEAFAGPFRLRPKLPIPAGTYRFQTLEARLDTFRRRQYGANVTVAGGSFYDGDRTTIGVGARGRFSSHLGLNGAYTVNCVDLPRANGRFTTHLANLRTTVVFSTNLVLHALLQYNSDTRQISTNVRFNWIHRPGSDFFIVYNELDTAAGGLTVRNRSLALKFNYLINY